MRELITSSKCKGHSLVGCLFIERNVMPKKKEILEEGLAEPEAEKVEEEAKEVKKPEKELPRYYKGYDLRWLKTEPSHPDYYLVKEAEGEVKE